ncbi:YaiI/YqxD family protein [Anoxybacteroides tepidamans]|uniref:YaiI/YqxD family protein n=1 Tax=Anoxybacteroides tepidamans TaxID=265948 RepID=UPI000484B550|nr:YaiI/YqxD family protein [Anoxybacillus tepidamans]
MTIFVDADACPVKGEIFALACQYNIKSVFVSSYNHFSHDEEMEWVYVDTEKEAVDLYIVNHAQKGDIVVTQDIGLASMLVSREICVVSPRGKVYEEKEMGQQLYIRHLHAKLRKRGIYTKGIKRFSNEERNEFRKSFEKILSKFAGNKR